MKTGKQGSDSILFAAISKSLEGKGGIYMDNSQIVKSSDFSLDALNQEKMWNISRELTGVKTFGQN